MRPILFDKSNTTFTSNGIGRLTPISCVVTEERNSIFELEMTVKMGCNHFKDIKHSSIIVAKPSPGRSPQPFRVHYISKPINGKVKVKAEHISYHLNYIPVAIFSSVGGVQNALNAMKANAVESCPFTFWTNISSNSSYAISSPESIRYYLGGVRGSILDVFGGEYEWDGYTVKLHSARGVNRGIVLRYGKNITDLKQEENIANTFTGVYPYWRSTEGQMVTLPEKVIHSANAGNFPFQRTITKDFSDKFDNAPTESQLRSYAQSYVNSSGVGVPKVSIDVSFIDLAQTEEYKDLLTLQSVELCDTIKVEFPDLGVIVTEKITKTVYDVLSERYTKIGVGDVRSSLAKTIEEQIDAVSYMPTAEEVQRGLDRATGTLNAGRRGHVVINRNSEGYANEILFLDNENLALAQNVLRINMNGIGFSSTGYQGPYYQSWTLDGHFALGGVNNAFGDFEILDANGIPLGEWDKDGLKFYDSAQHILMLLNHTGLFLKDAQSNSVAELTASGLNIYKGTISGVTIDIARGNDIGLYCDGTTFRFGDFEVNDDYGRQILESTDEMTGMGGEPDDDGGLYLWAGYHDDDDYRFVVNEAGAYTMYNGTAYNIGETLHYILENCCGGGGGGCDDCDSYGCDDEDCPGYGGEGCIPESAPCVTEPCSSEGGCGPCDTEESGCDSCDSEPCDSEQCGPGDGL